MAPGSPCRTCGRSHGTAACAPLPPLRPAPLNSRSARPGPPVPGSGPVQRERRDVYHQEPLVGGARHSDPRLTTRDCANRMGVSTNFIIGEIRDGRLAALVVEREGLRTLYRVSEAQLEAYLARYRWIRAERPDAPHEPEP